MDAPRKISEPHLDPAVIDNYPVSVATQQTEMTRGEEVGGGRGGGVKLLELFPQALLRGHGVLGSAPQCK